MLKLGKELNKWVFILGLLTTVYPGLIALSDYLKDQTGIIAVIWFANPLVLAILLLTPMRDWAKIMSYTAIVTFFSALFIQHFSVTVSALIVIADCMEPLIGAWLIKKLTPKSDRPFQTLKYTSLFLIMGLLIAVPPSAFIGALIVHYAFEGDLLRVWLAWALNDALGLIIFTPLFITGWQYIKSEFKNYPKTSIVERIALYVLALICTHLIFDQESQTLYSFPYLLFPFVLFFALRYNPFTVNILLTSIASIILYHFIQATGPFFLKEQTYSLQAQSFQTFTLTAVSMTLILSSMVAEILAKKAALTTAKNAAEKASYAKSRFLATMSHELRTPLNGVIGTMDLLSETRLSSEQKNHINTVKSSAKVLLDIIGDILDFSKIEAGEMKINAEPYNLKEGLTRIPKIFMPLAKKNKNHVTLSYDEELPETLKLDSVRVNQIILNLVSNAIKFSKESEVAVRAIALGQDSKRVKVRIEVEDKGIGIDLNNKVDIFESFHQADESTTRRYGGTGLGLSISKKLVRLMGGDIGVESQLRKGSTFWFELLLEKCDDENINTKTSKGNQTTKSNNSNFSNCACLVVEDDPLNQKLLVNILKSLNCKVECAANGIEALQNFKPQKFDIIFMDCMMPKMDGFETTENIRALELDENSKTPIIAVTANAYKEDEDACTKAGMNDFITKPFQKETIIHILEKHYKS